MELYSLALIARWIIPLWLLGWLVLPASRRIFANLPDGGLAAGRLTALLLVSLVAFWSASLHAIPLTYTCWGLIALPCGVSLFSLNKGSQRNEFLLWIRQRKKALWLSDIVFIVGFLFFVYLRLCQPEIRDQEKPMDSAIIGVLSRSLYLPADNPWFSGVPFTNYYYFGHFTASILKRIFLTPLPYAYNLVQPVFCAFFLSILWSLCAAITRSLRSGLLAMCLIALCGNYEPIRQLFNAWQQRKALWPLDWWSTSRVVPNTINEYPFFTLSLGDAHAHFFGISLGTLLLCCYHGLTVKTVLNPPLARLISIALSGIVLGAILMTNAWDTPLYFLLGILVLNLHLKNHFKREAPSSFIFSVYTYILWTAVPILVALPFLWRFQSPINGLAFELWSPFPEFLLHWGGFLCVAFFIYIYDTVSGRMKPINGEFSRLLLGVGTLAMILPSFLYIKGHFGGDLRHQDTIFKFWLQAWLLIGIPLFCAAAMTTLGHNEGLREPEGNAAFAKAHALLWRSATIVACLIPIIGTWILWSAHTQSSQKTLSLNGARYLPPAEQETVKWIEQNSSTETTVFEAVGQNPDGSLIGAYTEFGRISFLTGVPAFLGWPQHAAQWGISHEDIERRHTILLNLYLRNTVQGRGGFDYSALSGLKDSKAMKRPAFIVWGEMETSLYGLPSSHTRPLVAFDYSGHQTGQPASLAAATIFATPE